MPEAWRYCQTKVDHISVFSQVSGSQVPELSSADARRDCLAGAQPRGEHERVGLVTGLVTGSEPGATRR